MARKNRGLGRGLDALIPRREEIEKAMRISDGADVEVFFSDEEDDADGYHTDAGIDRKNRRENDQQDDISRSHSYRGSDLNRNRREDHREEQGQDQGDYRRTEQEQDQEDHRRTEQEEYQGDHRRTEQGQYPEEDRKEEQDRRAPAEEETKDSKNIGSTEESKEKTEHTFVQAPRGEVITVRISEVEPNREQPRKTFDEEKLEELSKSIAEYGILQPILVQRRDDHYEIIAGERRWRAALKAGCKEVPVIVRDDSREEVLALSLIENIQRENLNAIEEAAAYQRLINEFGMGHEEVAKRVSKSRSAITNALRLLRLDERVQKMVVGKELSMGHARALIPIENADTQYALARRVADEKMSVRETEKEAKRILQSQGAGEEGAQTKTAGTEQEDVSVQLIYNEIEERLRQMLHTKVVIKRGKKGNGKLSIEFYNHDDLEKIIERLSGSQWP